MVSGGKVFVASGSTLVAFNASGCGAATCTALWKGSVGAEIETSASAHQGQIYVGGGNIETNAGSTLAAFAAGGCGHATCAPVWRGTVSQQ